VTLAITSEQVTALAELRRRYPDLQMVLVGAAALQFHVELRRVTRDIDLAVVAEATDLASLLTGLGWLQLERDPSHRWRRQGRTTTSSASGEVVADFLPATEAILRSGAFRAKPDDEPMSMVGFDLALEHSTAAPLGDSGQTIEIASLPVLVLLKMVAWLDSPARRTRDLGDIAAALERSLAADDRRRWDEGGLLAGLELDFEDQGAYLVGHELRGIAGPVHRERVESFVSRVTDPDGVPFAQTVRAWEVRRDDAEARLEALFRAFRRGFGER
jgi:predicted nucleotidyltransferase